MEKGALDLIVDRRQLRDELARLLALLTRQPPPTRLDPALASLSSRARLTHEPPATLDAWLAYLETLHPKAIALGLDRVRAVRAHLDAAIACPGHHRRRHQRQRLDVRDARVDPALRRLSRRPVHVAASLRYNERVRIAGTEATDDGADRGLRRGRGCAVARRADGTPSRSRTSSSARSRRCGCSRAPASMRWCSKSDWADGSTRSTSSTRMSRSHQRRHRPRRLSRPDARGHRPREGGHLSRRTARALRANRASAGERRGDARTRSARI